MSHFVYILASLHDGRWYVGVTDDLEKRLTEHNQGKTRSTKAYRPYQLIYSELYPSKTEALKRERLIKKSGRIRKELKEKIQTSMAPSSIG